MKPLWMAAILMVAISVAPPYASAQHANGFLGGSFLTTVNDEQISGLAGGGVVDLAGSRISVGGQVDVLFKNGYVGGRGGPIAQWNFLRHRRLRLFAIGGMAWGVEASPTLGAGAELWSGPVGLRATVQDNITRIQGFDCAPAIAQSLCDAYFHGGQPYTAHKPSFQLAIAWR